MNPHTFDPTTHKVVPVNSVVLNPASGVVWEFLNTHPEAGPDGKTCATNCLKGWHLAQEIRKQMPAPRIPEPGWGVIVEAGVKEHDVRLRWINDGLFWLCEDQGEYARKWGALLDPKVVQP